MTVESRAKAMTDLHDIVSLSGFGAYEHNGSQSCGCLFVVQKVFLLIRRRLPVCMSVILSGVSSQCHPVGFNNVLVGLSKTS